MLLSSYWLSKPAVAKQPINNNRFSTLDTDDNEEEESDISETVEKQSKPPPIYVSKVENIIPLKALLEIIASKSYEVKILRNSEVKVQASHIESFKNITKALNEKNTEVHSFKPKQDRTYNVVLKRIHSSTTINEMKEELEELGHEVSHI